MNYLNRLTREDLEYILDGKSLKEALEDSYYTSQIEAIMYLLRGDNCFISGPAGSGKSYVLEKFFNVVQRISSRYHHKINIAKTSTTGISALNIGGKTIHSWSGMGASGLKYSEARRIKYDGLEAPNDTKARYKFLAKAWGYSHNVVKNTDILIIDEVSMLSERGMEFVLERIKESKGPRYQETQVIVSGDFSQLPPVNSSTDINDRDASNFSYNTAAWKEFNFTNIYLDRLYRAKDRVLSHLLNSISLGNKEEAIKILNTLRRTSEEYTSGTLNLLTTNRNVDRMNLEKQKQNENKGFNIITKFLYNGEYLPFDEIPEYMQKIAQQNNIPKELYIKHMDTVMITANNSDLEIYNGDIGVVKFTKNGITIEINRGKDVHIVEFPEVPYNEIKETVWENGKQVIKTKLTYRQINLRLAYAMTVHKSQGQTFSEIVTDLNNCWTKGLGYVALSRATNIDSITLIENNMGSVYNQLALEIDERSIEIKKELLISAKRNRVNNIKNFLMILTQLTGESFVELLKDLSEREEPQYSAEELLSASDTADINKINYSEDDIKIDKLNRDIAELKSEIEERDKENYKLQKSLEGYSSPSKNKHVPKDELEIIVDSLALLKTHSRKNDTIKTLKKVYSIIDEMLYNLNAL